MYRRWADAELISYLVQCRSVIFVDENFKNLNNCREHNLSGTPNFSPAKTD